MGSIAEGGKPSESDPPEDHGKDKPPGKSRRTTPTPHSGDLSQTDAAHAQPTHPAVPEWLQWPNSHLARKR